MKKGSSVKIVEEQNNRQDWMIEDNYYWGFALIGDDFHMAALKVNGIYEVSKARGVKGPSSGFIEVLDAKGRKVLVLKEDVIEV